MQSLLVGHESVVVIDSKHLDWGPFAEQYGYVMTADPADIRRHPKVVFQVPTTALDDRAGWKRPGTQGALWSEALASIFWRQPPGHGGCTLSVFDEGLHTLPSTRPSHPEARRLFTQGAALGLPAYLGTQAPLYVDTIALSQSEHMFSMVQPIEEYRDVVRKRRGVDTSVLSGLEQYAFAYHRLGSPGWVLCPPVTPVTRVKKATLSRVANEEVPDATANFGALTGVEPA